MHDSVMSQHASTTCNMETSVPLVSAGLESCGTLVTRIETFKDRKLRQGRL